MERGLREMSRTWRRSREAATGFQYRDRFVWIMFRLTTSVFQCHSQGQPPASPIKGKYYDWPVGFQVGLKLSDFWKLEEHKLGETSFTHFGDGTATRIACKAMTSLPASCTRTASLASAAMMRTVRTTMLSCGSRLTFYSSIVTDRTRPTAPALHRSSNTPITKRVARQ